MKSGVSAMMTSASWTAASASSKLPGASSGRSGRNTSTYIGFSSAYAAPLVSCPYPRSARRAAGMRPSLYSRRQRARLLQALPWDQRASSAFRPSSSSSRAYASAAVLRAPSGSPSFSVARRTDSAASRAIFQQAASPQVRATAARSRRRGRLHTSPHSSWSTGRSSSLNFSSRSRSASSSLSGLSMVAKARSRCASKQPASSSMAASQAFASTSNRLARAVMYWSSSRRSSSRADSLNFRRVLPRMT